MFNSFNFEKCVNNVNVKRLHKELYMKSIQYNIDIVKYFYLKYIKIYTKFDLS